ncbi:MAG: histidine phosphatase family protein [Rhodospirillales bacterium]|nr:MAG: histidine phosphatase family protein [Rhodospirillales bacterium]
MPSRPGRVELRPRREPVGGHPRPSRLERVTGRLRVGCAILVLLGLTAARAAADEAALWSALRTDGHVALLRHAIAPGTGDPSNFKLSDCRTQRNLSDAGREQAAQIGAGFKANGIAAARVYTSQWCRCRETAQLLDLGPATELRSLNSFFQRSGQREPQTRALRQWLSDQTLDTPLVLVTHQVNITALTGIYPASGELVVVRRSETGELTVVGTIADE